MTEETKTLCEFRYVRGRGKIHKPTCRYAVPGQVVGWEWAQDKDPNEWLKLAWLTPCKTCLRDLWVIQQGLRERHELVVNLLGEKT